ncbi:DUF6924 domain-containing protein [Streptomyces sp. NPDC096132]|uniref:DUF6924 domain-containing protein n=1 Tax=Streptomyces sp. NPDC096132 TaxID=3366075 RepID=UPI003828488C
MGGLPEIVGRGEFEALIIRTDHTDETAWREVAEEASRPWGEDGQYAADLLLVDDPAWAAATPEDVREAARRDKELSVVFVADGVTMRSPRRALLALDLLEAEDVENLDPVYYQELIDSPPPREFRTAPAGIHDIHANLSIGNMDFEEFAEVAADDPEGVYRSC